MRFPVKCKVNDICCFAVNQPVIPKLLSNVFLFSFVAITANSMGTQPMNLAQRYEVDLVLVYGVIFPFTSKASLM